MYILSSVLLSDDIRMYIIYIIYAILHMHICVRHAGCSLLLPKHLRDLILCIHVLILQPGKVVALAVVVIGTFVAIWRSAYAGWKDALAEIEKEKIEKSQ